MKNLRFWLSLIIFLVLFGAISGATGFTLIVTFDYVFGLLLPYAVVASCLVLAAVGLVGLCLDLWLSDSAFGRTHRAHRTATLHSLVYSVDTGSRQRRTRGAWNNV